MLAWDGESLLSEGPADVDEVIGDDSESPIVSFRHFLRSGSGLNRAGA